MLSHEMSVLKRRVWPVGKRHAPFHRIRHTQILSGIAGLLVATALFESAEAESTKNLNALQLKNLNALQLLAPASTRDARAGLARNQRIAVSIRRGVARQPTLLPFSSQRQQALRDAFMTTGNASQLADGLGTKLGGLYQASICYSSADDDKSKKLTSFSNISPALADLFGYAYATSSVDSSSGKYFFANGTTDGTTLASARAKEILKQVKGTVDFYGNAYGHSGSGKDDDKYGNPRPFQTEIGRIAFFGRDYFGVRSSNYDYLVGPTQPLIDSPSYPSGHTTYGFTEGLLLALLVPSRYPEMIARAAEYGNDRIILGAHYPMDVVAGRALATFDVAQLLANKEGYVKETRAKIKIDDFVAALKKAGTDFNDALKAGCHESIEACAGHDHGRFAHLARDRAFYESTQTYGLPIVYPENAQKTEDVGTYAPEAYRLLTVAFPYLGRERAKKILTDTEGPGGGFLDDGSQLGVYSRLDLFRASVRAIALAPTH